MENLSEEQVDIIVKSLIKNALSSSPELVKYFHSTDPIVKIDNKYVLSFYRYDGGMTTEYQFSLVITPRQTITKI